MPGLGQVYVGYYQRGFLHFFIAGATITLLEENVGPDALLGIFLAFFWLYNIVDAARRASFYNQYVLGGRGEELPDMPSEFGGRTAGIVLVAIGALLLLETRFDFNMRWLEDWWPAGLILFGAKLIADNRQKNDRQN